MNKTKYNANLADLNPNELFDLIQKRLTDHSHSVHKYADVPYREAAVLIPIFFKNNESHLLFTKRTDKVEHHKGQISFPGGMNDAADGNLLDTALRESWEEMGIKPEDITEKTFSNYLYTAGLPDVDLLIRTGDETRLSNFLLWQTAYSEYHFTKVLWPDFRKKDLHRALLSYSRRKRRFGGL